MATNRHRRTRINNAGLADPICRQELLSGPYLIAGLGYFNYAEDTCDLKRMEADWRRLSGDLMEEWLVEHPGTRPYAWWQFDAPEARTKSESERSYLDRYNLLEACEESSSAVA